MSDIFNNAIQSIVLGIEDYNDGKNARMLSAARNYYAGLLLLAKECLIFAAPKSKPMEIIGTKFKPVPDGANGVEYQVSGYTTIDLGQLRQRFKDFNLPWPEVDIERLQKFRNDLEHYHLEEPASALGEAIASSFPMIIDFFKILGKDPGEHLASVWDTIIKEREAFKKVHANCIESWSLVSWPNPVTNLDKMACPECSSSLVGQAKKNNIHYDEIEGKCFKCGAEIDWNTIIEMIVHASYKSFHYICPNCMDDAYVEYGEISLCFACGESIGGQCIRCGNDIVFNDYVPFHPDMCSFCAYQSDKVKGE